MLLSTKKILHQAVKELNGEAGKVQINCNLEVILSKNREHWDIILKNEKKGNKRLILSERKLCEIFDEVELLPVREKPLKDPNAPVKRRGRKNKSLPVSLEAPELPVINTLNRNDEAILLLAHNLIDVGNQIIELLKKSA